MKPIRTGSEDVFPDEVEGVLRYHPAVADAAVVGVPDRVMTNRLVALVAPKPGTEAPDADAVTAFCVGRLTGFKVPKSVLAVERIERLENGRIDYDWAAATAEKLLASAAAS